MSRAPAKAGLEMEGTIDCTGLAGEAAVVVLGGSTRLCCLQWALLRMTLGLIA